MYKALKYELKAESKAETTLYMPIDAHILSVEKFNEVLSLFVMVDTNNEVIEKKFIVFTTEDLEINNKLKGKLYYIGTQKMFDDQFLHIFEITK